MSLYNLIYGSVPEELKKFLFNVVGITEVGRFRDIDIISFDEGILEKDDDKDTLVIWLLTRDGGNNRNCIKYDSEENQFCNKCTGCCQSNILPKNPNYIIDHDSRDDSTYAETYFRIPKEYKEQCQQIFDERNSK